MYHLKKNTFALVVAVTLIGTLTNCGSETKRTTTEVASVSSVHEQVEETLQKQNLTICDVYQWIGDMEQETRRKVEKENPDETLAQRQGKLEAMRDEQWNAYRQAHQIPDSLRSYINGYGIEECQ